MMIPQFSLKYEWYFLKSFGSVTILRLLPMVIKITRDSRSPGIQASQIVFNKNLLGNFNS